MRTIVKKIVPSSLHVYLKHIRGMLSNTLDNLRPFVRSMKYKNYFVYYSRGTSLIRGVKGDEVYEGRVCDIIVQELRGFSKPIFLDIGANIGLISIYVLSQLPTTRIFAFEPGPHQYKLLRRTVIANHLEKRFILYNEALGYKMGKSRYVVHRTADASGDGFLDTGRAGEASMIEVCVNTIDNWWLQSGRPIVNVVKIDTEGSELWVLKGAGRFLEESKPTIFLEIHPINLLPYPYDHHDIVKWLNDHSYELFTTDDEPCIIENMDEYLKQCEMFIARPRLQGTILRKQTNAAA